MKLELGRIIENIIQDFGIQEKLLNAFQKFL
jgi:hypothetical protein